MNKTRLFQYAIIWQPTLKQEKEGLKPKLLVEPTYSLNDDISKVNMVAAMSIPTEYRDQLDQIEIVVRPF